MEVVRLAFNEYARAAVGDLDTRAHRVQRLSEQFAREITRPVGRALYLGVYDGEVLIGCVRLITETLGAMLVDALEVDAHHADRGQVERALLQAARDYALEHGKRLSVITYPQISKRWTDMGFLPDAQTVLKL